MCPCVQGGKDRDGEDRPGGDRGLSMVSKDREGPGPQRGKEEQCGWGWVSAHDQLREPYN